MQGIRTADVLTAVESRLDTHNIRYTTGRRTVVESLATSNGPLSAAELFTRSGPAVPLSSLYRSLTVLEEAGIVVRHFGGKGLIRYELAEWLLGHHHHLVCTECGSVEDISLPPHYENQIHDLIEYVGRINSFKPLNHIFEIEGRCLSCT